MIHPPHVHDTPDLRSIWESLTQAQRTWLRLLVNDPAAEPYTQRGFDACHALEDAGLIDCVDWNATALGRAVLAEGVPQKKGGCSSEATGSYSEARSIWESLTLCSRMAIGHVYSDGVRRARTMGTIRALERRGLICNRRWFRGHAFDLTALGRAVAAAGQEVGRG